MPLYETPNLTDGVDGALADVAQTVPIFIPMFLVFVWFVVFLGGTISQKRRGSADIPMWATLSSIATFMIALPLSLVSGLMQIEILAIVIVVTIVCGIWLYLDKTNREL